MRAETRLIKNILNKYLPDTEVRFYVRKPRNYYVSSDIVGIKIIKSDHSLEDICFLLSRFVSKISVGTSKALSVGGKIDPKVYDIAENKWVEVEAEFIRVYSGV